MSLGRCSTVGLTFSLEPYLGGVVVWADFGQAFPKSGRMIEVIQVNQFVQNYIVPDKGWHLY